MRKTLALILLAVLPSCGDTPSSPTGSESGQVDAGGHDAGVEVRFSSSDPGRNALDVGVSRDVGADVEGGDCPITCGTPCEIAWAGDACFCDCPIDSDCSELDYCGCIEASGCETVEIGIVCPCDMECPGYPDCVCGAGGGTFVGCAPTSCDPMPYCGEDCSVHFDDEGCPECICPEPVDCSDLAYCDCRDTSSCEPVVRGPTCGLDCECEGHECACASGQFIGCVDAGCLTDTFDDCPMATGECELAIGEDGCPECVCDEPPGGCRSIDDYCTCSDSPACQPLTDAGRDCGYECECGLADCDCGGTEMLACQPRHCERYLPDACDIASGRCELVWNDEGCPECQCTGEDDVCEGLDFCDCLAGEGCQPVTDTCICPCDYACPGFEDCVCSCGGGEYLGCEAAP